MNKRCLLGAAASAATMALGSAAIAQPAPEEIWTGPYVGANIGATWGNTSLRATAAPAGGGFVIPPGDVIAVHGFPVTNNSSTVGLALGGELGYNWQMDHLLLGVETDGGVFDIRQSRNHTFQSTQLINPPVFFTISQSVKTDWMWTLRPRIGYAWGPWLAYFTGGLAVTDARISAAFSDTRVPQNVASFTHSSMRTGGTVGLGGAWMFAPGWSGKLEWLYSDFGNVSGSTLVGNGFAVFTSSGNVRANVVRTGVDYKF